jgi:hypothetical protein
MCSGPHVCALLRYFIAPCVFSLAGAAGAASLGSELLVNGDAEAGDTTGWSTTGVEAVASSVAGLNGLPAGVGIGAWSFTGGIGPFAQSMVQTVDVGAFASAIDHSAVVATFSILIQSRGLDRAYAYVNFRDAGGDLLSGYSLVDRIGVTFDWDARLDRRAVPAGTRSIEVLLDTTRSLGVSTDAFFDNASLVVTSPVPEPGSAAIMLGGLTAVATVLERRRRGTA